jgi:hypothetical protein
MQSASQLARFPSTVRGKGLFGKGIQLASTSITFDGSVKARSIENLEPRSEPGEFGRRQPLNRLFNFFCSSHLPNITLTDRSGKDTPRRLWRKPQWLIQCRGSLFALAALLLLEEIFQFLVLAPHALGVALLVGGARL